MGASLIGTHLQQKLAMFAYNSFTFDINNFQNQKLRCEISLCVEGQPCGVNFEEKNCPTYGIDGLLKFSVNGDANQFSDIPDDISQ